MLSYNEISDKSRAVAKINREDKENLIVYLTDFRCDPEIDDIKGTTHILLKRGNLEIVPRVEDNQRDVSFVFGAAGSGKTTFCCRYLMQYLYLFKERNAYVITKHKNDPSLKLLFDKYEKRAHYIYPDKSWKKENPLKVDNFKNCVIMFDDFTLLSDPYKTMIVNFLEDALQNGRHFSIDLLISSHIFDKFTKLVLKEAYRLIFFPCEGGLGQLDRYLKTQMMLKTSAIKSIYDLRSISRWVCLCKYTPLYIAHERGIYLL